MAKVPKPRNNKTTTLSPEKAFRPVARLDPELFLTDGQRELMALAQGRNRVRC